MFRRLVPLALVALLAAATAPARADDLATARTNVVVPPAAPHWRRSECAPRGNDGL